MCEFCGTAVPSVGKALLSMEAGEDRFECCGVETAYLQLLATCVRVGGQAEVEWCRRACERWADQRLGVGGVVCGGYVAARLRGCGLAEVSGRVEKGVRHAHGDVGEESRGVGSGCGGKSEVDIGVLESRGQGFSSTSVERSVAVGCVSSRSVGSRGVAAERSVDGEEGCEGTSVSAGEVGVGAGFRATGRSVGVGGSGINVRGSGAVEEGVQSGSSVLETDGRGKNWARNRAWKEEKRRKKAGKVPAWRVGAAPLSPPSSVATVSTRTAEEIEAARTLAIRRTVENKVAIAQGNFRLKSYADKEKTEVIKRLEVARIEEQINTTKAKSQASYKKCASPLESVGSAKSAGEFAWKQEIRKREALKIKSDYLEKQLEKAMLYLPDEGKRIIAEMPEPYIPSDEDIAAEDADICPYLSYEEMELEAEKFVGAGVRW